MLGMTSLNPLGKERTKSCRGGTGDDILVSRNGKEKIDGGKGYDTLYLPDEQHKYHITKNDKGEFIISNFKYDKDGNIKFEKDGTPTTTHKMTAKNIEDIRFGSDK